MVTVGSIHGGTKHNIIPDEVKLQLTLRAFSEPVRQQLIAGIRRRVEALARAHQAPEPTVEVEESTPPTINSPALVERVVPAFVEASAPTGQKATPVMGAEDFCLFGEGASRSACSGWARLTPRGSRRPGRSNRTCLPFIRPSTIPTRTEHRDRNPRDDCGRRQALAAEALRTSSRK